jgi:hypothetical protein
MQQLGIAGLPVTKLRSAYDLPDELIPKPHSRAFADFIKYWFFQPMALSRRELDCSFLHDLTPVELHAARKLIRVNLQTRHIHIIDGAAALEDVEAIPILRAMFADESEESRRLTIAGSLWKLARDPVFVDCLEKLVASPNHILKQAHYYQVLWLKDARSIDFMIRLLDDADDFVRSLALSTLNTLEFGQGFDEPSHQLPSQPDTYRARKNDPAFRSHMLAQLQSLNLGW